VTSYLHVYGVLHEHWHIEDFYQTRNTHHQPAPVFLPPLGGRWRLRRGPSVILPPPFSCIWIVTIRDNH
jgi:hypothetical protein